jgi:hypothetical protein
MNLLVGNQTKSSAFWRLLGTAVGRGTPMSRADYFRRQANTCLRLSLISSSEEVANRLVVMAQDYRTKADASVTESKSLPAEATNHASFTSENE